MSIVVKFFIGLLLLVAFGSIFLPIVTNPNPVQCDNFPDGTGGYYLKCRDEYITLYKKLKIPKNVKETKLRTF